MAIPTSVASSLQYTLPVAINSGLEHVFAETDPAFDVISTSMGVVKDGWGRDFEIKKAFQVGLAGVVQRDANQRRIYGDPTVSSALGQFVYGSALQGYPNPQYGNNPEPQYKTIRLGAIEASLMFTKAELDIAALPNQVGSTIPGKTRGFMENLAQVAAVDFYTAGADGYICVVGAGTYTSTAAGTNQGFKVTINITDGNIYRLRRGMQVDLYTVSAGHAAIRENDTESAAAQQTRSTRKALIVASVDYNGQTAVLWMPQAVAAAELDPTDAGTDVLLFANSRKDNSTGSTAQTDYFYFTGLNTFLISTGTILQDAGAGGGINVATFPEFKSLVATASGTATEQYLRKVLSEFQRSFAVYGWKVDSALTTRGVYNGYLTNKIGSERRDRTSQPLDVSKEGTKRGWGIVHDGLDIEFAMSDYCTTGHMYIIKRAGGNWKRYVPPSPQGVSKNGTATPKNMEFEFVGPELGWSSNKIPMLASDGTPQDGFAFYGRARWQMVPDQIPGIKLTGFTEDSLV